MALGNERAAAPARPKWSTGSYTDRLARVGYWEYRWQHPLGAVLDALLSAGLVLETVAEHPYCSYRLLEDLDISEDGMWRSSGTANRVPYMYSAVARRGDS